MAAQLMGKPLGGSAPQNTHHFETVLTVFSLEYF